MNGEEMRAYEAEGQRQRSYIDTPALTEIKRLQSLGPVGECPNCGADLYTDEYCDCGEQEEDEEEGNG